MKKELQAIYEILENETVRRRGINELVLGAADAAGRVAQYARDFRSRNGINSTMFDEQMRNMSTHEMLSSFAELCLLIEIVSKEVFSSLDIDKMIKDTVNIKLRKWEHCLFENM